MAVGIGIESPIRVSVYHASRSPRGRFIKVPGTPVGEISIRPAWLGEEDYNPFVLTFTVSPFRKDLNTVRGQSLCKDKLPPYEKSLFDSCFKNW